MELKIDISVAEGKAGMVKQIVGHYVEGLFADLVSAGVDPAITVDSEVMNVRYDSYLPLPGDETRSKGRAW